MSQQQLLAMVLRLVSYDLHDLYLRAKPHIRRLMNQAIFEAIWIGDAEEVRSELASPFKETHEIKDELDEETKQSIRSIKGKAKRRGPKPDERIPIGVGAAENDEAPDPWKEAGDFDLGSISASMVGLFGALSNHDVQGRLRQLSEVLDRVATSGAKPCPTVCAGRELRPGMVPKAIMRILAESVQPMRATDIHLAVEEMLGLRVSKSAVKNWLATHVGGERPLFVRLARGRYCLSTRS